MNRQKLLILFFVVFIVSLSARIFYSVSIRETGEEYNRIAADYTSSEAAESGTAQTEADHEEAIHIPESSPAAPENQVGIDFAGLREINPDIYAWISIPGTTIEYPIVQSPDDDAYYLNYTVERKWGLPGSIYTEQLNRKDFTDRNTVIYGHNMKDGSMFAGLHQYKNADFMKENQLIYIYTPEQTYTYRIFAGVTYHDSHLLRTFDFNDMVAYQEFLDSLRQVRTLESYVDTEMDLTLKTRLITLSTCTKSDHQRFLVVAKLLNSEEE